LPMNGRAMNARDAQRTTLERPLAEQMAQSDPAAVISTCFPAGG
jgi:hypothetical protein